MQHHRSAEWPRSIQQNVAYSVFQPSNCSQHMDDVVTQ